MDESTRRTLSEVNQRFYREAAQEFSRTRHRAWAGWSRVIDRPPFATGDGAGRRHPVKILDVGCGNGRFGVYLQRRLSGPFGYLGVDSSLPLLRIARSRLVGCERVELQLAEIDLERGDLASILGSKRFDAITLFGVLHHIPGRENRRRLLQALVPYVAPGGLLAISFWQFADRQRFADRVVDWGALGRAGYGPVESERLEPGDYLLRWGAAVGASAESESPRFRYCHHASDTEIEGLVRDLPLEREDRFRADGGQNRYEILRR